jgi:hypothetical protein
MRRNTKVIAATGLIPEPREIRAVVHRGKFLDDIKCLSLSHSHRVFKAVLEIDGSITLLGHSWCDGFPSYPLAAVRNLAEGRKLLDPAKPTGGWPYWHYLDEITGQWESLAHLWDRARQAQQSSAGPSATPLHPTELKQVAEGLLVSILERLKQNESKEIIGADAEHDLSGWVAWPKHALLLWEGCVREREKLRAEWIEPRTGKAWKYVYPPELDSLLRRKGITPDRRMRNGPPQTTFLLACGECPRGWEHHHLYDGKPDDWHRENAVEPLHAVNHPLHFTQSAGIVAITHEAHLDCGTDSSLRFLLRLVAWLKFGYDPDKRFSMLPIRDDGFEKGYSFEKVFKPARCADHDR